MDDVPVGVIPVGTLTDACEKSVTLYRPLLVMTDVPVGCGTLTDAEAKLLIS